MKERPILFTGEIVRATLDDRKWVTRRVIKPQPELRPGTMKTPLGKTIETAYWHYKDEWWWQDPQQSMIDLCPYGKPGDRLWVKETFWIKHDSDTYEYGPSFDCGINIKEDSWTQVQYCATPANPDKPNQAGDWWPHFDQNGPTDEEPKEWVEWDFYSKQPSIFMPRWASRLTLEITGVRVERVQQATLEDMIAEGCPAEYLPENCNGMSHAVYGWFEHLWDSINLKRGYPWKLNPWVWVVEFKRVSR